mmetsp:Transcript_16524/g.37939  ORF Transcript_16524/g.37939 Transcript_16524/m.37939 type:complete len:81 (-) Transcript_16524:387-629(-)
MSTGGVRHSNYRNQGDKWGQMPCRSSFHAQTRAFQLFLSFVVGSAYQHVNCKKGSEGTISHGKTFTARDVEDLFRVTDNG